MRPNKKTATLIGAIVILAVAPSTAHAMRIVSLSISVDGKPYLVGSTADNGARPEAIVWRYFSHIPLQPREGVVITPDANDPKRATLKGKIVLDAHYGGKAEVQELHLVRADVTKNEWTVDGQEVQKIAETIGLGTVPMVLPDRPTGNNNELGSIRKETEFPWIWVIGVVVAIVVLAGLGCVLLLRPKAPPREPAA